VKKKCIICGSTCRIECHHKTYDRVGNELDRDLCWLCRKHHILVHSLIKSNSIKENHKIFRQIKITKSRPDNLRAKVGELLYQLEREKEIFEKLKSKTKRKASKRNIAKIKARLRVYDIDDISKFAPIPPDKLFIACMPKKKKKKRKKKKMLGIKFDEKGWPIL